MLNESAGKIGEYNSCGSVQYAKKDLMEVEAESPEAYVKANGRFPILENSKNAAGDIVIVTGDGIGNMLRYTFTEC